MGVSALHHRNLALLMSLGALPACPGNEGDTSNSGTTSGGSTSTTTAATTTAMGSTTDMATGGSGGASASEGGSSTSGMVTTGQTDTGGSSGGSEVPAFCVSYAAKVVECYPRYASMQSTIEQYCAMQASYYMMNKPECAPLFGDLNVCISGLDCATLMGMTDPCPDQSMALEKCVGP